MDEINENLINLIDDSLLMDFEEDHEGEPPSNCTCDICIFSFMEKDNA